jgi:hypothetical protein
MPSITAASLTIRGRVNSRVVSVYVDGSEITLAADKTFAHTLAAPASGMLTFTTIDSNGYSESRAVTVTTTAQAAPPPAMPSAPA